MALRVISGTARGRKLKSISGDATRPITDQVKEALFNILAGETVESTWWDLFAGTGAVGIEALSRGASLVRFSDLNKAPIETIKWNLDLCRFSSQAEIIRGDAFSMLSKYPNQAFDFIFIAPPQFKELWSRSLTILDRNPGWLKDSGLAIVQIAPKEYKDLDYDNFLKTDERKYGNTLLVFFDRITDST